MFTVLWVLMGLSGFFLTAYSLFYIVVQLLFSLRMYASSGNCIKLITNHMGLYLKSNRKRSLSGVVGVVFLIASYNQYTM